MNDILAKNSDIFEINPEIEKKLKKIIDAGTAENTKKAYKKDLGYFKVWMEVSQGQTFHLPIEVNTVLAFIAEHLQGLPNHVDQELVDREIKAKLGTHRLTTVKRRISSLSALHEAKGLFNPTRDQVVKKVFTKATKAVKSPPKKSRAITKDILEKILENCDKDLRGKRDAAIVTLGFASGGRRRSEIANIKFEDIQRTEDGYLLKLNFSKTDQEGQGVTLPILGLAGEILEQYLEISQINDGSLFRPIKKGQNKVTNSKISPKSINTIIKTIISKAGFDKDKFSAHGLRSGFITEAGRKGVSLGDVMALSTHKSIQVAMQYYQAGSILNNPAAKLL